MNRLGSSGSSVIVGRSVGKGDGVRVAGDCVNPGSSVEGISVGASVFRVKGSRVEVGEGMSVTVGMGVSDGPTVGVNKKERSSGTAEHPVIAMARRMMMTFFIIVLCMSSSRGLAWTIVSIVSGLKEIDSNFDLAPLFAACFFLDLRSILASKCALPANGKNTLRPIERGLGLPLRLPIRFGVICDLPHGRSVCAHDEYISLIVVAQRIERDPLSVG